MSPTCVETRKVTAYRTLRTAHETKRYNHGSKEVQLLPFSTSSALTFRDTRGSLNFSKSIAVAKHSSDKLFVCVEVSMISKGF